MKTSKQTKIIGVISVCIFLIALTLMILEWAMGWKFFVHPVLDFFFYLFAGLAIMTLCLAILGKSTPKVFLAGMLFTLVAFYVVFRFTNWWIALICAGATSLIFAIMSLTLLGNATEAIALNKDPEYKDYKERKAEAEEKAKTEEEKPEELPKIKSFKD